MVLSVSGCSRAEDAVVVEPALASNDMTESELVADDLESDAQRETPAALDDSVEPSIDDAASPRGASREEAAPEERTLPVADELAAADDAATVEEATTPEAPTAVEEAPVERATLQVVGREVLDTCGKPFVTRGVEQIFGEQLPQGNDWLGLLEEISDSGVNAVRILAGEALSVADVDALLNLVAERGLVAYVTPYADEAMQWLGRQEVRTMLAKHEKYIILDAFGEPTFDDRDRFLRDSTAAIRQVRSWGYRAPLTVTANQFGRDLPSLFELGPQIVAADPLGNTILGWQAYWGSSGYYHQHYGMSFEQALDAISLAPFPIQLGLDRVTDYPSSETADYEALMSSTQAHGVGWLWWDWYNPYGNENNLTRDGKLNSLTATGSSVIETHSASVQKTAQRVCVR